MHTRKRPIFGGVIYFALAFGLGLYFTYAAVQGDFGLLRRAEIDAVNADLEMQLAELQENVAEMENLTKRLSDTYLDLDLLDQQARDILGMIRADEVVVN